MTGNHTFVAQWDKKSEPKPAPTPVHKTTKQLPKTSDDAPIQPLTVAMLMSLLLALYASRRLSKDQVA